MPMSVADEIRKHVFDYVLGKNLLCEFEDWFTPVAWSIEKQRDTVAQELVYQINTLLAEVSNGDRTEENLRSELLSLVSVIETPRQGWRNFSVARLIVYGAVEGQSSSVSPSSSRFQFQASPAVAGAQFAMEREISFLHLAKYQTTTAQTLQSLPLELPQEQLAVRSRSLQIQVETHGNNPAQGYSAPEFSSS